MRPARALINLQALRHNYQLARRMCADKALAVVKADAYGHGAVACAQALHDIADGFAVSCLEEALELRAAGVTLPIVLLEGFFQADELRQIVAHNLWCVVHSDWQLEALERAELAQPLTVWLKMDSGMHRVGFFPHEYQGIWQRLQASANVASVVLITHFSRADEPDSARTHEQFQPLARRLRACQRRSVSVIRRLYWHGRIFVATGRALGLFYTAVNRLPSKG